ncbi:MAG TPA: aldo/keto reductase [Xanthomonadaceae bacterium]|nr:aldo/keto reductase [Xanthomonadaceae bacterium]
MYPTSIARRRLIAAGLAGGALAGLGGWSRLLAAAEAAVALPLVKKPIPSSGELLPVIGIGTSRRYDVGADENVRGPLREVIRRFAELGGTLIDTAPSYGQAEGVVGDLVDETGLRDALFIATKVGAGRHGAEAGMTEMEASLHRLRSDRSDLLQVHNLAGFDAMLPLIRDFKDQGKTRYIGASTSSKGQYGDFEAAMRREDMDFIQVDYAIDNRDAAERILPLAADRGMAVLVNLPFGRGRVLQHFRGQSLPEWATELGIATWAQFALKYVVSHPAVTAAIPGTATLAYLEDNLAAARGPMPDAATREKMAALIASG